MGDQRTPRKARDRFLARTHPSSTRAQLKAALAHANALELGGWAMALSQRFLNVQGQLAFRLVESEASRAYVAARLRECEAAREEWTRARARTHRLQELAALQRRAQESAEEQGA